MLILASLPCQSGQRQPDNAATLPALRSGSAAGGYPFLEFDAGPNPLLDLCGRPAVNGDGTVTVPDGPGFGIELNADMLSPFVVARQDVTAR